MAKRRTAKKHKAEATQQVLSSCGTGFSSSLSNDAQHKRPAFTKVPSKLLGAILDAGLASAPAAHLLAIKASKGPLFVLNEHHVARAYGISRRMFQRGIALMKSRMVLERRRNGRTYAIEQPLPTQGGFVIIEDILLRQPSKLVAFILVVRASPRPMTPLNAARRIGLVSAPTSRKLARAAIELDAIASARGQAGELLIARRGYDFKNQGSENKNGPEKRGPENNDASHRPKEERTQDKESLQNNGVDSSHDTLARAVSGSTSVGSADPSPEWITLADWRNSDFALEREWHSDDNVPICMSLADWAAWLEAFGVNAGHLRTPAAHRQALALAHELYAADEYGDFSRFEAMAAIACAISNALAAGKTIRSLGFIAQRLLRATERADTSWVVDRRSYVSEARFVEMNGFGDLLLCHLRRAGIPVSDGHLVSTMEIEQLEALVTKYGRDPVVQAVMSVTPNYAGKALWSWSDLTNLLDRRTS